MIDTSTIERVGRSDSSVEQGRKSRSRMWQRIALGMVMLISIFMNFYQLGQNGFGNLFYASGVRSMADSLHNFFFVSYDPGGFVTLDKPPLGFWLQALSVKIFGFTPFSVFLPQALAGVLAVLVLYYLVRRHFGVGAGLLAALALAISPISVVTNRNNTIDSTLALTLLLGAWAIMRAAETGKWRWLLLSAVAVGLGFNVKMLEAYLVVPAFGLLYLLAAPRKFWVRLGQLAVAALVLLVVSFSWAVIVDLTPASLRPYVGSSQDNSEISLALGYNGADRLLGRSGFGGGNVGDNQRRPDPRDFPEVNRGNFPDINRGDFPGFGDFPPPGPNGGGGNAFAGGGGAFGVSGPGVLRLFTEPLGGQIVWLLPTAILAMLALAWRGRPRFRENRQQQALILWGTWLLTMGIFFSVAGFFHQYYMTVFAPAICALFGIGIVIMWQDYRRGNWRGWLLPLALLATALEQIYIISSNPAWGSWFIPLIIIPCGLVTLLLILARAIPRLHFSSRVLVPAIGLALAALLLVPAYWSAIPAVKNIEADLPIAGPSQESSRFGGFGGSNSVDNQLISYLEANQGNTTYLVATPSSMEADGIILATNRPVMALGGFSGGDPILTTDQLQELIANGTIRFFLLSGPGGFRGGPGNQASVTGWVQQNCTTVPANLWQSASTSSGSPRDFGGNSQLYDCANLN